MLFRFHSPVRGDGVVDWAGGSFPSARWLEGMEVAEGGVESEDRGLGSFESFKFAIYVPPSSRLWLIVMIIGAGYAFSVFYFTARVARTLD